MILLAVLALVVAGAVGFVSGAVVLYASILNDLGEIGLKLETSKADGNQWRVLEIKAE